MCMQLEAWARSPPYAFACSGKVGHIIEANSIQLLRAFFRQIRAVSFAHAFNLMASLMKKPLDTEKAQAAFEGPSAHENPSGFEGPSNPKKKTGPQEPSPCQPLKVCRR